MHGVLRGSPSVASELQGQFRPGRDKIVTTKFKAVAQVIWPEKTAFHLAAIGECDERQAKRWLAGEYEPPIAVVLAMVNEIFKRD